MDLDLRKANEELRREIDGLRHTNDMLRCEIDGLRHTNDMLRCEIDVIRVLNIGLQQRVKTTERHNEDLEARNKALSELLNKAASAPKLIRYHDADEYEVEIKPESTRFSIIWGGGLQDASFPAETMNLGSLRDRYNTIADVMAGGHDDEG